MSNESEMKALIRQTDFKLNQTLQKVLILFVLIGLIGFIIGLFDHHPQLVWQSLLTNFIFFSGLSFGGITLSVIFTITSARWGRPIKRFSEALFAFAPVSGLLLILLFFGTEHIYEWVDPTKVIHSKAGWLNLPFFIMRNILAFAIFVILGWKYLGATLRPDIGLAKKLTKYTNPFADRLIRNYSQQKEEVQKADSKTRFLAPILGLLFALLCTLQAFDWMMSIDQEWFSTMFGVQYAMANLTAAMAALMIIAGIAQQKLHLENYISINRYHDLAKLTFSGCLMWSYMVFSQVLVIWYSNIPEETPYLILRMQSLEWGWMFWVIGALLFILPFVGLVSKTACRSIFFSRLVAIEILIGFWLEKYFLIVPSVQENYATSEGLPGFSLNLYDIVVTAGIFSTFLLCYFWFLKRVPVLPIADTLFKKENHS